MSSQPGPAARVVWSRAYSAKVVTPRTIPLLPCADIDVIEPFFAALGFRTTYRQLRPNPALGVEGHGIELQYYGLPAHTPEASHSSCIVIVEDTGAIWEELASGLREAYGKLPVAGFPRITRPRARKNADGVSGFSLIDPAGNWLRFFNDRVAQATPEALSRLGEALANAVVLADSKGDEAQAAKILRGALGRAPADDPAGREAQEFLDELDRRLPDA